MGRLNRGWIGFVIFGALPMAALPQAAPTTLVGAESVDTFNVKGVSASIPLRHGDVISNSELITLNGTTLRRGIDYSVNYLLGIVLLSAPHKIGDSVRISYRFDQTKTTTFAPKDSQGLSFDLMGVTQFGLIGEFGLAQHNVGGKSVSTNIMGFRNSLSLSGGKGALKGLFLMSSENALSPQSSGFNGGTPSFDGQSLKDGKHSRLIVESLDTKFMGGSVKADVQQIGQNFNAFDTVASNGFSPAEVAQMQREKGLTRYGFGFTDIGPGGFKVSNGFRTVQDGKSAITWRNMGFKTGGLTLDYSSQSVDSKFARFNDLSEADRDQLSRETGLTRENLVGGYKSGKNDLGFTSTKVVDENGHKIQREQATFKSPNFSFDIGRQNFESGFGRVGSLTPAEQQRYGLDTGLKRKWEDFSLGFIGAKTTPLHFNDYTVESKTGSFHSQDVSVGFKGLTIVHSEREIGANFHSTAQLQPGEIDASIANIGAMYDPFIKPTPQDRGMFLQESGIDRSSWQFTAQPLNGWKAGYRTLRLDGQSDGATLNLFTLNGKDFALKLQRETVGKNFNELRSLMTFEQQRLGTIQDLTKTDIELTAKLFGNQIAFSQMKAETALGDANRTTATISGKTVDFSLTSHGVDKGFTNANQLVDPDKDVLFAMLGQKGTDAKLKWRPWKTMSIDAQSIDQTGNGVQMNRKYRNVAMQWNPSKHTELGYQYLDDESKDPASLLFFRKFQRVTLKQDIGRNSVFRFAEQEETLAGTNSPTPSDRKTYFSFQSAFNKNMSFMTERTETTYENGASQTLMTNTLSAQLSPKIGVSVTDVRADNKGVVSGSTAAPDTSHNDYGIWFILPNGMKLSYGDVRNTIGSSVEETKNLTLTPGQIGNVKVDSATYADHYWDNALTPNRTQSASNVSLSTVKPFRFGPLHDMHFNFGFNALSDRAAWQQENRIVGVSAKIGTNSMEFGYRGQLWTNGYRAIDRLYKFSTDTKPNRFLTASLAYKIRTLPWDEQNVIRDFSITMRPAKNFEISNHLVTNPEIPNGNALLGSTTQIAHSNEWRVDYKRDPNLTFGGQYSEMINETTHYLSRTAGLQATMFGRTGSPVKLFYGLQQFDGIATPRNSQARFSLQFDQKPGPNQTFSFFISNLNYGNTINSGQQRNNWTVRFDYGLKF